MITYRTPIARKNRATNPQFTGETRHNKDRRQAGRQAEGKGKRKGGRREISPGKTMI